MYGSKLLIQIRTVLILVCHSSFFGIKEGHLHHISGIRTNDYIMTLLKQSIVWTAVLLYHRLKMAARRKHRYRLSLSTFCTGVIHKLAYYFNYSIKNITIIVGKKRPKHKKYL